MGHQPRERRRRRRPDRRPGRRRHDNRHELYYGTDPFNPASNAEDTDADGLLDAGRSSTRQHHSQDGYGDPDGDLATNEDEETAATDPNDDTQLPGQRRRTA